MPAAPRPSSEEERLAALESYHVLDTACEENFDNLTRLAAALTGCPKAMVSLVDRDRQWFKSRYGLDISETSRADAICAHAILNPNEPTVVPDAALDPRFADSRLVTGPFGLRFYAGVPLVTQDGHALGTLCVLDHTAREISRETVDTLEVLAQSVMTALELRRIAYHIRDLSLTDQLTGIANRGAFTTALEQVIARQRRDAQPFTLLYLDLDGFKAVNDRLGHAMGDKVLMETAEILRGSVRKEDTVARLGGDEFAAVLVGGRSEASVAAERIRAGIENLMEIHGWDVTASLGAVTFTEPPQNEDVALALADSLMYKAKQSGRNRIVFETFSTSYQRA